MSFIEQDRPKSKRQKMTRQDRAAQFSPFAALTSFDSVIDESYERYETYKRLRLPKDLKVKLSETEIKVLEVLDRHDGISKDELFEIVGLPIEKLIPILSKLEELKIIESWKYEREI